MKIRDDKTFKVLPEAIGSYQMMEMHLFDNNAGKENGLCGADTSADDLGGADGYLEDRFVRPFGWRRLRGMQDPGRPVCREPDPGRGGRRSGGRGGGV